MRIISNFKYKDYKYVRRLAKMGDVLVIGNIKYIKTDHDDFISELGSHTSVLYRDWEEHTILIKKEFGEFLEDILREGEKRCKYY